MAKLHGYQFHVVIQAVGLKQFMWFLAMSLWWTVVLDQSFSNQYWHSDNNPNRPVSYGPDMDLRYFWFRSSKFDIYSLDECIHVLRRKLGLVINCISADVDERGDLGPSWIHTYKGMSLYSYSAWTFTLGTDGESVAGTTGMYPKSRGYTAQPYINKTVTVGDDGWAGGCGWVDRSTRALILDVWPSSTRCGWWLRCLSGEWCWCPVRWTCSPCLCTSCVADHAFTPNFDVYLDSIHLLLLEFP